MRFFLIVCVSFLILQCNGKKEDTTTTEGINNTPVAERVYPSIPREKMMYLWDNCNSIDLVVLNQPFSVSTNDNQQSRSLLRHISVDSAAVYQDCAKVATISYVGNAGILLDGDLYFSTTKDHCNYFVFYEEGKPTYGNLMTQEGYDYYKQLFSNVQVQQEQK